MVLTFSEKIYAISFDKFKAFIHKLSKEVSLIGPKKKNKSTFFSIINDYSELSLDKVCDYPLKYAFMPDGEVLFEFTDNHVHHILLDLKEKVVIGARRCDLAAVSSHDKAFNYEYTDANYNARREHTTFIGIHCPNGMDEYCFCESLKKEPHFDLMLYPRFDHFLVEVGSEKGEQFLSKHFEFFEHSNYKLTEKDKKMNTDRLKNTDISKLFGNQKWEELSKKCVSCAACNLMCASCFCFDILDEVKFDLKTGKRIRKPASCQLRCFSRVAGEGHFRDKKIDRYKHRIYHQLQYFKDRHGFNLCTGCGRCIRHCPNKIEFVNAINEMK